MIKTEFEKEYCMSCGKENPQDRAVCECGGRNFVFGDNFNLINNTIICGCGSDKFKMVSHVNMNPIHNKTYRCVKCNNTIGIQTYAENPYV